MTAPDHPPAFPVLHRAAWLAPVTSAVIDDGAVLVNNGSIMTAGHYDAVRAKCPPSTKEVDHGSAVIMPALVNAHTHLELSALRERIPLPQSSFASWLEQLLPLRATLDAEVQKKAVLHGMQELLDSGVSLCGDISNRYCLEMGREKHALTRLTLFEVLGFNVDSLDDALGKDSMEHFHKASCLDPSLSLAAHACYSVSEQLLRNAKAWCRSHGKVFSIHVAEHPDEIEFLFQGTGFCRALLENLGRWVPTWTPPCTTPVGYLDRLGVLDQRTLLVHAVHMTEPDWEIVVRSGCSVCFCPRSNANLNAGRPDVEGALKRGVAIALGTDSLASNKDLNLFAEAAFLLGEHKDVSPKEAVFMSTMGGATALRQEHRFGSIDRGKSANLLAVALPGRVTGSEFFEAIIDQGKKGAWRWINHHPKNL